MSSWGNSEKIADTEIPDEFAWSETIQVEDNTSLETSHNIQKPDAPITEETTSEIARLADIIHEFKTENTTVSQIKNSLERVLRAISFNKKLEIDFNFAKIKTIVAKLID